MIRVFAISDILAIGAVRAIVDSGLKVPEDISVVGYDGIEMGKYVVPSMSSLYQPVKEIAKDSSKLLFDLMSGKKENQHKVYEGELIVRESTKKI